MPIVSTAAQDETIGETTNQAEKREQAPSGGGWDLPQPANQEQRAPCPAPANFTQEVARYDQNAKVQYWQGPHYKAVVRTLGEGPPIVVAPGIASTYRGYAYLLNLLSQRFKTVVYDYPGENKDDGAKLRDVRHADLVDDFFGVLEFLRLGRVFPLGISFGSTVVLSALAREPRRFPKAALQGGFPRRDMTAAERMALGLGRLIPGTNKNLPLREKIMTYNHGMEFPAIIKDRWKLYLDENGVTPIASLSHRLDLLSRLDLRPLLPSITTEVLLIHGKEDRIVARKYFDELMAGLPNAKGVTPPCVGHQTHYTHPELMARSIEEFLLPCQEGGCPSEAKHDASASDELPS